MLKVLKIAATALSVAAFSLAGSPGWGEPQPTEYGFPITEIPSDDLPKSWVSIASPF